MGIIYLLSVLILIIAFVLVKKTEKEINIISFICISIVTFFCYNTFICYILTFFTIPITLWLLTLINLMISSVFVFLIKRTKKIQKYTFNKIDIIYICIIALVTLIVSYMNFGFPFDVNYETGDPSVHYLTSMMFAESDALLAGVEPQEVYGDLSVRKTVSYVNSGLLMKCLCENIDSIESYNIFVWFGIFTFFLTGVSIFSAMRSFAKTKEHVFWAFIISLICILGYPLNSLLFGFEYLSIGLLIICVILDLINYYDKELLDLKLFIPIMALLNFGLFSAYYMFVPFIYPALWIYFCIQNYCKTKKIVTKELIVLLIVTLLIPFILGYIYHLAPKIYAIFIDRGLDVGTAMNYSSHVVNTGLPVNGYIYVNFYSNMLMLLPLPIYLFIRNIKDKELKNNKFIFLLIFFIIAFMGILFIGNSLEKVSIYYLCKNHFALWIILLYCNYKALVQLSKKGNYLPRLFISVYIFLMVICTIFSNTEVEYVSYNRKENVLTVMEIFGANKTILLDKAREFNQDELEILRYVKDNLDYNSKIEVIADENAYYWQYVLLDYVNKEEEYKNKPGLQAELRIKWQILDEKINKVDYIVYFNKSEKYKELEDKLFENSEIIYENSSGGIIRYKN